MVGNSEELNKNNFGKLNLVLEQFTEELPYRIDQLEGIRHILNQNLINHGTIQIQLQVNFRTLLNWNFRINGLDSIDDDNLEVKDKIKRLKQHSKKLN